MSEREDYTEKALAAKDDEHLTNELIKELDWIIGSAISKYGFFAPGYEREDLKQEGMLGLYKAIQKFDKDKEIPFVNFAYIVVGKYLIAAVRKATRQKHTILNKSNSLDSPISDRKGNKDSTLADVIKNDEIKNYVPFEMLDPVLQLEQKDLMEKLIQYKSRELSGTEDEIFTLFYLEGYTYDEIVQMLDIKIKDVDNALQRSKKKLSYFKTIIEKDEKIPINEEGVILNYCSLPFEKRLPELKYLFKEYSQEQVFKTIQKLKRKGFIAYGTGWNAEAKAILTEKGKVELKRLNPSYISS